MNRSLFLSLSTILCLLLSACASGYKPIRPKNLTYSSSDSDKGIGFHYRYNVLAKKYASKEYKKNIRLIAVKLTNDTERNLVFGQDITLAYDNGDPLPVLEKQQVFKTIKQSVPTYLLYLLLTPLNLTITDNATSDTTTIPIGLAVGPGVTAGNMITAGSANKKFKQDLMQYDIQGKLINPGETVYGLIGYVLQGIMQLKHI